MLNMHEITKLINDESWKLLSYGKEACISILSLIGIVYFKLTGKIDSFIDKQYNPKIKELEGSNVIDKISIAEIKQKLRDDEYRGSNRQ
jgi:hypothetical protein